MSFGTSLHQQSLTENSMLCYGPQVSVGRGGAKVHGTPNPVIGGLCPTPAPPPMFLVCMPIGCLLKTMLWTPISYWHRGLFMLIHTELFTYSGLSKWFACPDGHPPIPVLTSPCWASSVGSQHDATRICCWARPPAGDTDRSGIAIPVAYAPPVKKISLHNCFSMWFISVIGLRVKPSGCANILSIRLSRASIRLQTNPAHNVQSYSSGGMICHDVFWL